MSRPNGHRHLRRRLPTHLVQLAEEEPTPWYEHELVLVLGALLALLLTLFTHVISEVFADQVEPVFLRLPMYVTALVLGGLCMRGAGNTLRSAGSVTASNGRLLVATFAGFAVMFSSALALFSFFALLDHNG